LILKGSTKCQKPDLVVLFEISSNLCHLCTIS